MAKDGDLVATVRSINSVIIRITKERWTHVITQHQLEENLPEILATVSTLDMVYIPLDGYPPQKMAIKTFSSLKQKGLASHLAVHYKELSPEDSFLITAFTI